MEISGGVEEVTRRDRLHTSLANHTDEMLAINGKLANPGLADEKGQRLLYRYFVIKEKIIPRINRQLEGSS